MRVAHWENYELLDVSDGERLERFGEVIVIRPDPQVIWSGCCHHPAWRDAHARYHRSKTGGGHWEFYKEFPTVWNLSHGHLTFRLKAMGFKHTGVFPEQAINWSYVTKEIERAPHKMRILNLFAYTGGATLAAASAGAEVCHVDASKGMVTWAKGNAVASGLKERPIRWIVDDCLKFVQREQRRSHTYDAIIMDPPSYGRGPGGELWKLEEQLSALIEECCKLLSERASFFMLNSYTGGLSPTIMAYLLRNKIERHLGGCVISDEIGLRVSETGFLFPCGSTTIWQRTQGGWLRLTDG